MIVSSSRLFSKLVFVVLVSLPFVVSARRVCMQGICINAPEIAGHRPVVAQCPETTALSQQKMYWGAPGGWVSYNPSFITKVTTFVAAQWQGIKLGKVLCVYTGKKGMDFPIVLQQTEALLVPKPVGLLWAPVSDSLINCIAPKGQPLSPAQCAFIVERPEKSTNPYQELDSIKRPATHNDA